MSKLSELYTTIESLNELNMPIDKLLQQEVDRLEDDLSISPQLLHFDFECTDISRLNRHTLIGQFELLESAYVRLSGFVNGE